MAIPTHNSKINALSSKRDRELTTKQKKLLANAIDNGFDLVKAATDAGYSRNGVYTAIRSVKEEILSLTTDMLVTEAPAAAQTFSKVMKSDDVVPNAAVRLQAAREILDRIGVTKPDKLDINHNISGGIFLIPAKEPLRDVIDGECVDVTGD